MRVVAIMPARSEAWILGLSARALLMFVDFIVILNHASTDRTQEIIDELDAEYPGRVKPLYQPRTTWEEMADRQWLLEEARQFNPSHIICIDADEVLCGNTLHTIRDHLARTPLGFALQMPWIQLRGSADTMHASGLWSRQWITVGFVNDPALHWKPEQDGYQHHHREPYGMTGKHQYRPVPWGTGGLMHFQMASERRLRAKQYLYTLIERKRWPKRKTAQDLRLQYSPTVYNGTCPVFCPTEPIYPQHDLKPVPAEYWEPYRELRKYLDADAEPWQEAEVFRMLSEDPSLAEGLDDFGVMARMRAHPTGPTLAPGQSLEDFCDAYQKFA